MTVQANMKGQYTSGYRAWEPVPVHGNQAAGWWYGGQLFGDCIASFGTMGFCTGITTDMSFELLGTSNK